MSRLRGMQAGSAALALGLFAASASAQAPVPPNLALSSDTVEVGELFELSVTLSVPPGSEVYFPDTLPATVNLESAAPARIRAEALPEGGATLELAYPLMAFGSGTLPVPGFDVLIAPRGTEAGTTTLPGGSVVGAWTDAPRARDSARLTRIPRQAVWVAPVFTVGELAEGVEPMPPNDVAGASWSWPSVTLMLLCSALLVVTLVSSGKGWWDEAAARRGPPPPPTPAELRQRALAELDALLAEGLHENGRLVDFYTRGTDIVRRYVEARSGVWTPSLTSTELMERLRTTVGDAEAGALPTQVATAEIVKFGRFRPGAGTAERHWRALRDWIGDSGAHTW